MQPLASVSVYGENVKAQFDFYACDLIETIHLSEKIPHWLFQTLRCDERLC